VGGLRGVRRLALLGGFVALMGGCSPFFVLRAGYEEAKILSRRQSIARLVDDPDVPADTRAKLRLVLDVRAFAEDSLRLDVGDSYTTFSQLDSDTLAMVLSAARKDSFEPYTWWFPIIGRVPYRAFFNQEDAAEAVQGMEERGFDAYVRPTSAFSTLGWFNDPLVSPLLRYDSVTLANTVIHELLHNTLYLPGQAIFNESLAQFVGARGAIAFFCTAHPDPTLCATAEAAWQDELLFGAFLSALVDDLEALYARTDLDSATKIAQREHIFSSAQQEFESEVRPRLRVLSYTNFIRTPLNNASLISRRIYYRRLDLFEQVYQQEGELYAAIRRIIEVTTEGDTEAYEAVEGILGF
jgi:predicted aminopeptidase